MLCIPTHGVLNRKLLMYTEKEREARSEQLKKREANGRSRACVLATRGGGRNKIKRG